jgi:hypothetical protein
VLLARSERGSTQAVGAFGSRYASEDADCSQIGRCGLHGEISVITAAANSRAEAGFVTRRGRLAPGLVKLAAVPPRHTAASGRAAIARARQSGAGCSHVVFGRPGEGEVLWRWRRVRFDG